MPDPVIEAMDRFAGSLDDLTRQQRRELLNAYRSGWRSVSGELSALQAKLASAPRVPIITGTGTKTSGIPPSWLFQQDRYVALQGEVRGLVASVGSSLEGVAQTGIERGWSYGAGEAQAAGTRLAQIPIASWASIPQRSFQAYLGGATSGPLGPLLASFIPENGPEAARYARDVLGAGLLRGRGAAAVAADLQEGLRSISFSRAYTIAQTETVRAYREGARQNYLQNRNIVQSWTWRAAVENSDPPPCAACFAQHGSVHPLSEPLSSHPRCRCRMVPNRSPVLGVDPRNPVLPDAKKAFDSLPAAAQRRILGPTRLNLYQSGRVQLRDFATSRSAGRWGTNNAVVRPISELRTLSSQGRALPQASDRLFAQAAQAEPGVSSALQRIGQANGAELEGFGFRLKTPDRIAAKIRTDVLEGKGGIVKASEGINDALRYTYRLEAKNYGAGAEKIMRSLQAEGMSVVKTKNFWQSPGGYRGYHAIMRAPNGARFELQFHTRASLAVKERSHVLYEIQRLDSTSAAMKARLQAQMDDLWGRLQTPRGAKGIPDEWAKLSSEEWYAQIAKVESEIVQNREYETAVVFDTRVPGRILLDKRGAQYEVEFTAAEEKLMRGNLLTHNHPRAWNSPYPDGTYPGGSSFSTQDVYYLFRQEIGEMRAVTNSWTHTLRRGPAYTGEPGADLFRLNAEIYKAEQKARETLNAVIEKARVEAAEIQKRSSLGAGRGVNMRLMREAQDLIDRAVRFAEFEHNHLVWTYVQEATNFILYERLPR